MDSGTDFVIVLNYYSFFTVFQSGCMILCTCAEEVDNSCEEGCQQNAAEDCASWRCRECWFLFFCSSNASMCIMLHSYAQNMQYSHNGVYFVFKHLN